MNFIWYRVLQNGEDGACEGPEEGVARSCDLSASGIGLVTPREIGKGSLLMLEVMTTAGNLSAVGRVCHVRPAAEGCFRLGLELEAMPPNDRRLWAELTEASAR